MKKLRKCGNAKNLKTFCKKLEISYEEDEAALLEKLRQDYDITFSVDGKLNYVPINTEEKRRRKREAKRLAKIEAAAAEHEQKVRRKEILEREKMPVDLCDRKRYEKAKIDCLVLYSIIQLKKENAELSKMAILYKVFEGMPLLREKIVKGNVENTRDNALFEFKLHASGHLYDIVKSSLERLEKHEFIKMEERYVTEDNGCVESDVVKKTENEVYTEEFRHATQGMRMLVYLDPSLRKKFYQARNEKLRDKGYQAVIRHEVTIEFVKPDYCYQCLVNWIRQENTLQVLKTNICEIIRGFELMTFYKRGIRNFERQGFIHAQTENITREIEEFAESKIVNVDNGKNIPSIDELDFDAQIFDYDIVLEFKKNKEKFMNEVFGMMIRNELSYKKYYFPYKNIYLHRNIGKLVR